MPYETNDAMIADLLKLGKDNKEIQQACTALRQQKSAEAVLFLLRYKQLLLQELHTAQQRIDLLDFLLYQLKQNKNERR